MSAPAAPRPHFGAPAPDGPTSFYHQCLRWLDAAREVVAHHLVDRIAGERPALGRLIDDIAGDLSELAQVTTALAGRLEPELERAIWGALESVAVAIELAIDGPGPTPAVDPVR